MFELRFHYYSFSISDNGTIWFHHVGFNNVLLELVLASFSKEACLLSSGKALKSNTHLSSFAKDLIKKTQCSLTLTSL